MKYLIKCGFVFVLFMLFCGIALAQQNDSGREGASAAAKKVPLSTKWLKALPDGEQLTTGESKSLLSPEEAIGAQVEKDLSQAPIPPNVYTPVWKGLDKLSLPEKENALLRLDVFGDLSSSVLRKIDHIEALWNSGDYDQAIEGLRSFEESDGQRDILVEISWKTPRMTSHPKWGTDVRIGERYGMLETCLDFDDSTGNLFAVVLLYDGEYWTSTVNFSSDGGQTWGERFWIWGPNVINDISGVVLHGYFYIGVTVSWNEEVAIYRFSVTNGVQDYDYGPEYPIDEGVDILEIALTSNADYADDRIYLFAILANDSLICRWSDEEAVTWMDVSPYIDDADHGLDACYNVGASGYLLFVSYVDVDDSLHVVRLASKASAGWKNGWHNIKLDYADDLTSVGAYQDRIITAFEYIYANGQGIKYWISYDGGEEWRWGNIAEPSPGQRFSSPDVAARKGGGIAVVYEEEVGEPDLCWYRHRDYGTGPGTATWSDPEQFNEIDVVTGLPMTVEWIPPLVPYCHAHGSIWIGEGAGAYFDRIDREPAGDANGDGQVNLADAVYLVNWLFIGGPAPDPIEAGDANGSGGVDLADAVYIVNWLFIGGPPPCCQ